MVSSIFSTLEEFAKELPEREISQCNNINANTRLFFNEKEVIKVYTVENEITRKNRKNILAIIDYYDELKKISELVLPKTVYFLKDKIMGFSMEYVEGTTLRTCLLDNSIDDAYKIELFYKMAKFIYELPENIHIGDFHADNVIVTKTGDVKFIDIDGFSIDDNRMSCPIDGIVYDLPSKYYDNNEWQVTVSRNSDIYCFYSMLISFLIGFNNYKIIECSIMKKCVSFLCKTNLSEKCTRQLLNLFNEEPNVIEPDTIKYIKKDRTLSYENFKESEEYKSLEKDEMILNTIINTKASQNIK